MNFQKMQNRYGSYEFNYIPESYVLPDQLSEFKASFLAKQNKMNEAGGKQSHVDENVWIIKPASSSRGRGIYLLRDFSDLPSGMNSRDQESFVISRYIHDPLLVNGHKFDVRIYVLITGLDPLKVYIYNEGLVRFASEPY